MFARSIFPNDRIVSIFWATNLRHPKRSFYSEYSSCHGGWVRRFILLRLCQQWVNEVDVQWWFAKWSDRFRLATLCATLYSCSGRAASPVPLAANRHRSTLPGVWTPVTWPVSPPCGEIILSRKTVDRLIIERTKVNYGHSRQFQILLVLATCCWAILTQTEIEQSPLRHLLKLS